MRARKHAEPGSLRQEALRQQGLCALAELQSDAKGVAHHHEVRAVGGPDFFDVGCAGSDEALCICVGIGAGQSQMKQQ